MLEPTILKNLLSGGWETLPFSLFRDGISISSILEGSPAIAVLRYEPGARVPLHEHVGAEIIFVLEGAQADEKGTYCKGDIVINPAGSRHSVWSDDGCVVLLHWAEPVKFIEANTN